MAERVLVNLKQLSFSRLLLVAILLQQTIFISACSIEKAIEGSLPKVGIPDIDISNLTIPEGGASPLAISIRKPLPQDLVLNYTLQDVTTEPGDFASSATGSITILAGQTIPAAPLNLAAGLLDALYEGDETFSITFADPKGRTYAKNIVVADSDSPPIVEFQAPANAIAENGGSVLMGVQISGLAEMPIVVPVATAGGGTATAGTDYTGAAQFITIPAGVTTANGLISITNDVFYEGDEIANLELLAPSVGTLSGGQNTQALTINEDEVQPVLSFFLASSSVAENVAGGLHSMTLSMTGTAGDPIVVNFNRTGGTATEGAGADYILSTPASFTIPPFTAAANIPISILNDLIDEPSETINFAITGANLVTVSGTNFTHTVTITDDDFVTLAIAPDPKTAMDITLGSSPGATVTFTLTNSGNIPTSNLTAAVLAGANPANFNIVTDNCVGNALAAAGACTILVQPIASANGVYSATLTIGDGTYVSNSAVLSGAASGFTPALTIAPDPKTGMDVTLGSSPGASVTFTVTNTGTFISAALSAATLGGTNPGNFNIVTDNCNTVTLAIAASCTVIVRPVATANGSYSATLTIGDGAVTSNSAALSGTASGFIPTLAITPDPKSGMNVTLGSSPGASVTFTLTNTGTYTTATLGAAALAGANPGNFNIVTDNCSTTTLAIAAQCTIVVRPVATANGVYSATLTIGDGAVTSNAAVLSGTASGFIPALAITPDPRTAMDVTLGSSPGASVTFTVTNTGTYTTAALTAASLAGANPGNFNIVTDSCNTTTLAIAATCTIIVQPIATANGAYSATLTIGDGAVTSNSAVLSGTASGFTPTLTIAPDPKTAMDITLASSPGASVTFTVTNSGTYITAVLSAANLAGTNPGNFNIISDNCGGNTLAIAATCTIVVQPIAVANGAYTATLNIDDGAVNSNAAVLSGTASGFAVDLVITPDPKSSMDVTLGSSPGSSVTFTVTNGGSLSSAALNAAVLGGANPGNFNIVTDNCNTVTLGLAAQCTIIVEPVATANGAYSATLTIGDGGATSNSAVLSGTASGFIPALAITPDPKTLMDVTLGSSPGASVTFTLTNTGTYTTAALNAAVLAGANPGNFNIVTDNCNTTTLAIAAQCTIIVEPTATANGAYSATLTIGDGAVTSNAAVLSGTASGFIPSIAITPDPKSGMDITLGSSPGASVTFTLTNTGTYTTGILNLANLAGANPANFNITADNCVGIPLAIASTCTIIVEPQASANGAYAATLTVGDGAITSNSAALSGTASGFIPALTITPDPKTAMDVTLGSSPGASVTFTVTNSGTFTTAALNAANLAGANPGNFNIVTDNCSTLTLAIAASCTVIVEPTATGNGAYAATLNIDDGAVFSNAAALTGTATGFAVSLALTPDPKIGMDITLGSSPGASVTFTLTNVGTITSASLNAAALAGANPGNFNIVTDNCTTTTLAPAATCTVIVEPVATNNGAYSATLTVGDGAVSSNSAALSGTASGFVVLLAITPDPKSGMDITLGTSPGAAVTFTLTNTGTYTSASLNAAALAGVNPGNFNIVTDNCTTTTLAPAATCTVIVEPVATNNGAYSATLSVGDGGVTSNAAALSGTASGFSVSFAITPDPKTGMNVTLGSSPGSSVTFTLTNTGTLTSAALNPAVLGGANPGNFNIVTDNCNTTTVAPAAQCTIIVEPTATANGAYAATLTIGDGGATSNSAALSGTASGFIPALTITPDPKTGMNVTLGSSPGASVTFTVTNTGTYITAALNTAVLAGTDPGNFNIVTDNCDTTTLAIAATCTIIVEPLANFNGAYSATLTVGDGAVTSNSAALSGTASGFAPVLAITPDPKSGMDVTLGSSPGASVTFTLTNTGTYTTAALNAAALGGANAANFNIVTDNCNTTTLAIAATCTIIVQPVATANGAYSATLTIGDGGVTSNSAALSGTASGFTPALAITPDPKTAMDVTLGSSPGASVTFTLTNTGTFTTAALNAAALGGTNPGNFNIVTDNCSTTTLAIAATCTIVVQPVATANGAYSATLTIGDGGVTSNSAALSGTASGFTPALAITPDPKIGMNVTGGSSPGTSVTFTLTNTGTYTTAALNPAALGGTNPGNFNIVTDNCNTTTLAIAATCTIIVEPVATANGAYSATLTIGDGGVTSNSAALSGTASGFAPALAITPDPKAGMNVTLGSSPGASVTFTLTNTGTYTTAALNAAALAGTNPGNFNIVTDNCNTTTLAIAATCTIIVQPVATMNGAYSATLTIGDGGVTSNSAALSGTASGFAPALTIAPDPKTLMNVTLGSSPGASVTFTLTNSGTYTTAALGAATLAGTNPGNFNIVTDNCNTVTLAIAAQCTIIVEPTAITNGAYAATLSISDGGVTSNLAALSGTASGFAASLVIAPDPKVSMDVTLGSSPGASVTFTVTNAGAATTAALNAAVLGGANAANFNIVTDNCNTNTLIVAGTCTIIVQPVATANGAYSATLTIGDGSVSSNAAALSGTASGFAPALAITPDPKANMDITLGSSPGASVTFTLTNTGTYTTAALNAAALGGANPGNFNIVTDNCNTTTLAIAATCTIIVQPIATANGAYSATLTIGDGGVTSNSAALSGAASGFAPALAITPDPKTLMNVTLGSSPGASVTFTLTNTGTYTTAALNAAALGGTNPGNFNIVTDNCNTTTLAIAATCTIIVQPVATANGAYSATLTIGDGGVTSNSAVLSGTASGFAPALAISPDPKTLMDITLGSSPGANVTFTLTNTGTYTTAALNAAALGGTNPGNFNIVTDNCNTTTLAIAATCTIIVQPVATANGAYSATLTIGDGGVTSNSAALSGTASGFAPALAITPDPKASMDVTLGSSPGASVTFTLTNTGTYTTATLNAAALGGTNPGNFNIVTDNCNTTTLAIAATCTIIVEPTATANGAYSATLTIGDGGVTSNSAALSGTASGFAPALAITPDPKASMNVTLGSSPGASVTFTLTNTGTYTTAALNAAALAGTNPGNFNIVTDNCNTTTLAIAATCTIIVQPVATANGAYSATLTIGDGAVTSNSAALSGTASGFAPALAITPDPKAGMDVTLGSSPGASVTFTLTNTGTYTTAALNAAALGGANPGNFNIVTDNCNTTTLAIAATCTIIVQPTAVTNGAYAATLTIGDGAVTSNSAALSGTASGFAASLAITPDPKSGMNVTLGSSPGTSVTFTVTNTGAATTAALNAAVLGGANAANFNIVTDNCNTNTLIVAGTCTIIVQPVAVANGAYSATLTIGDGSVSSNAAALSGTASGFAPILAITPDPKASMDVTLGSSPGASVTFTLTNSGNTVTATLNAAALGGTNPGNFNIVTDNCNTTTLAIAATCTIIVQPIATANGAYSATLTIGDGGVTSNSAALSGAASGFAPALAITPDPKASMDIAGGSSPGTSVTFTLTNTGTYTTAALNAAALGGANPGNFNIVTDNCNTVTLAIAATCTIVVQPIAVTNGAYSATLTIGDGAATSNSAALSGTASGFVPALAITPDPKNSMDITLGSSPGASVTFTLTNTGAYTTAALNAAALGGTNPGNFNIVTDNCNTTTLAIAATCTIIVQPIATANGAYLATLTIGDGAVTSNSAALSGTASGFAPALAITPDPKTLMDITLGSSPGASVTFTLTNTGTYTTAALNAAALAGTNPGNFNIVTDNCNTTTLAIAATCTIVVQPIATTNGAYSATLTIGDGAVTSNSAALSGTASGFAPALAITPDPKTLMDITLGSSPGSNVTFTLTNTGAYTTAALNAAALAGTNPGNFNIVTDNCNTTTLAIAATCTIVVRPVATANGAYSATLTIGDGAVTSNSAALSGTASGFTPVLAITPDPKTLMDITLGSSPGASVTFTLTNTGTYTTAALNAAALGGTNPGNFNIVTDNCNTNTLAIAATCTIVVRPVATANGAYSATLTIGDGSVTSNSAALSGTASGFAPVLAITPDPKTLMDITLGSSPGASVTFTLTNTGTYISAALNLAALGGTNPGNFSIVTDNCNGVPLNPAAQCTIIVQPVATANGAYSATLAIGDGSVTSNAAALSGTASGFAPVLAITPDPKTLMDITLGSSPGASVTFTLTNTGTYTTAALNGAALGGTNPGNFNIVTDNCNTTTLAIAATCTIIVQPIATTNGAYAATLTIGDGGVTSNSAALSGAASGFAASLAITPDPKSGMDITLGSSPGANVTFTVTNSGAATTAALNAAVLGGANAANFNIVTDNCNTNTLAIAATCTIIVRPVAVANGAYAATLTIGDGTVSSNAAALSGTASGFAPILAITPDPKTLMDITLGSSPGASVTFTLTNTGTYTTAALNAAALGGTNPGNFNIVTDNCNTNTLAIAATCTIIVRPVATANGAYSATLTIGDGSVTSNSAALSGTASGFAPALAITPDPKTLMDITLGSSPGASVTFTLTNTGTYISAALNLATLGGTNPGNFNIVTDNCNGVPLNPAAQCTIVVRPVATTNGAYSATLTIGDGSVTSNAAALSGTASGFAAILAITPTPVTGMDIVSGVSPGANVQFTLTNSGTGTTATLNAPVLGGTNAANFEITTNNCTGTLAPAATCTMDVRPKGSTDATFSATLTIGDGTVTSNSAAISGQRNDIEIY